MIGGGRGRKRGGKGGDFRVLLRYCTEGKDFDIADLIFVEEGYYFMSSRNGDGFHY